MTDNKPKKYHLTEEEKQQVLSRKNVIQTHNYVVKLVDSDIQNYISNVIYKRIAIPFETKTLLSDDCEWLTIEDSTNGKTV